MARTEARLILEGVPAIEINKNLMKSGVTDRSLEAVKGKRRAKVYKDLVQSLIQSMDIARSTFSQSGDVDDAVRILGNETLVDIGAALPPFDPCPTPSSASETGLPETSDSHTTVPVLASPNLDLNDDPVDHPGKDLEDYNAETVVYVSPETYIYQLNND